jgi:hypothetical protein
LVIAATQLKLGVNNMADESILWRRLDRPGHESARLTHLESSWRLSGTAVFAHERQPCRLNYLIDCDSDWRTVSANVTGWLGNQSIEIEISVDGAGRWTMDGTDCPPVSGCTDVDLNFSPSTNLLPIRRLELEIGTESEVQAAWLRFPSFKLERLDQRYRRIDNGKYRYESAGGAFVAELEVNSAGFVTRYPGFCETVATG